MIIKKNSKFFFISSVILVFFIINYLIFFKSEKKDIEDKIINKNTEKEEVIYNSNIINEVSYKSKDSEGNEYIINALKGEIDYSDPNILYLTNVEAKIKLKNSEIITITSDYGKYNSDNFDTIFTKNVIIDYLVNKITGEYLDFSLKRNSMIVSRNVVYTNLENILKADVIEVNIKTKDTKIYMHETEKKVNIKSKNFNGNNKKIQN